jgi:hypothetical protein
MVTRGGWPREELVAGPARFHLGYDKAFRVFLLSEIDSLDGSGIDDGRRPVGIQILKPMHVPQGAIIDSGPHQCASG